MPAQSGRPTDWSEFQPSTRFQACQFSDHFRARLLCHAMPSGPRGAGEGLAVSSSSAPTAVLCFHQHSRFVPSKISCQRSAFSSQPRRSGWRKSPRLGSAGSRRDRSGRGGQSARTAPSAHRRRSKATSASAHDLVLSFHRHFRFVRSNSAFSNQLSALSHAGQAGADP